MTLLNNTLPEQRRGKLKSLLKRGALVRVLEAHNGLSGILANNVCVEGETENGPVRHEYDAIWESSLTDSASKGHPDIEVISFDSRLATISEILAVTSKPMIVDGDTGGDPNNFEYMVSKLERAGVSAVIIEDKVFPKRNSLETGAQQTLEDPQIFAQKIKRGKKILMTDDFLIIARIESLIAGKDMDVAIERAKIYLAAGVDGIMIHSKSKQADEVLEFARRFKAFPPELIKGKPLVCVPTTYNTITEDELAEAGFNIAIYANHLLRSAYKAMEETAKTILSNQRSFEADPQCAPVREIFSTVGFLDVKKKDEENELSTNVPVIIPAAGEDPVLKEQLKGKPKAMLDIAGKTLIQRQIEVLNHNNLTDITVITGYAADQMKAEGVTFIENKNYKKGTSLQSILSAKDKLQNGWLMLYADIFLQEHILPKILSCKEDIVLVVDNAPQYHQGEKRDTLDYVISKHKSKPTRRKISFVHENIVEKINSQVNLENATHEFIGLAKFSKTGGEQFLQTYQDCIQNHETMSQTTDPVFRMSFTDLIQKMIDRGFTVNFLEIHQGWLEIHQPEDIELANKLFYQSPPKFSHSV